jgi:hypothetical protein
MSFARIYADNVRIEPGTVPHLGSRHYVELNLDLTTNQWREALAFLISQTPPQEMRELLQSEFPDLLTEVSA